jgi:hypothetical protein
MRSAGSSWGTHGHGVRCLRADGRTPGPHRSWADHSAQLTNGQNAVCRRDAAGAARRPTRTTAETGTR